MAKHKARSAELRALCFEGWGEIADASNQQALGVEQVNEAIAQIDQATQQNAAMVEQMAASATGLRDRAVELVDAMAAFKLDARNQSQDA